MSEQIVKPRIRGFVCTTAHPEGCARMVEWQVEKARENAPEAQPGGKMLVLGGSTGYGLASRIAGAFRYGMDSLCVCFERPPTERRTASAGWYNTHSFHRLAAEAKLEAETLNGDAFSKDLLEQTIERLKAGMGPVDILVYSLASPRRTDPETGETYQSALKTVGDAFSIQSINLGSGKIEPFDLEPASREEIASTVAVMGGSDLRRWVDALLAEGLLAPGARVVAYSYLGPEVTWPVYRHGTIGHAKADLEVTCSALNGRLAQEIGGSCHVSINKSIVTQASAAIPAVPLYMSLLFDVMKEKGTHEGPIEQAIRLLDDHLGPGKQATIDEEGRIRLDDLEMAADVQAEVMRLWNSVDDAMLAETGAFERFQLYFRELFGFDVPGVDYSRPVEVELPLT